MAQNVTADIVFCGNPGVGKSTVLSNLSGLPFHSGLNWGEGLTSELDFKAHPDHPGVRFGDTPGLADFNMAERAAKAITKALKEAAKHGRKTLIFFVVTVESGRIKPDDLLTVKKVMGSITLPDGQQPAQNDYAVIYNKCSFLDTTGFKTTGRKKLKATFEVKSEAVPFTTSYITFLPYVEEMVDKDDCKHDFEGLEDWIMHFPGIFIASAEDIDVSGIDEQLAAAKELHKREMEELEKRLRSANEAVIQQMKSEMEITRLNLELKLAKSELEAAKRKSSCSVM